MDNNCNKLHVVSLSKVNKRMFNKKNINKTIHPLLPQKKSSKNKYLLTRAQTYSHYKSHNTVQVLIGITLQGSVCLVSKAWVLNIEHCGMLKNVRPGDLVMADRGFTIEENLSLYQAKLAIPAFSKGKSQSDPVSVEDNRNSQCTYTCRKGDWVVETKVQCVPDYIIC